MDIYSDRQLNNSKSESQNHPGSSNANSPDLKDLRDILVQDGDESLSDFANQTQPSRHGEARPPAQQQQ